MKVKRVKSGFMLAELAIVLIIVGVLASMTVFAAQFLESGKNQSLIYEITALRRNVAKFYEIYKALPGDFENAGAAMGASRSGNGNGFYDVVNSSHESLFAWHHMAKAAIITGNFTFAYSSIPGVNLPKSRVILDGGYRLGSEIPVEISGGGFGSRYKILLELAGYSVQNTTNGRGYIGAVRAVNMQEIDVKIDDGEPLDGFVLGLNDANLRCNTGSGTPTVGVYQASIVYKNDKTNGCIFSMILNEY